MLEDDQYESLIETKNVTVLLEKPAGLEKTFTSRDRVMSELGLTRERLLGEAVRYALVRGKNTNFLELEAPIEDIESNLDLFIDTSALDNQAPEVDQAVNKFIDSALEVTTNAMLESHSLVSNLTQVMDLHNHLKEKYGESFDLKLKDVKVEETTGLTKVELSLESEVRVNRKPNSEIIDPLK